jgi:protein-tyrosine phosphatase
MIDLHLHVLPGIDDGASSFEEAEAMCRLAAADGVEVLVATPHQHTETWDNRDPERLEALRAELQRRVGERPRILPGAEIRVDTELLADLADPVAAGLMPLAGSRYLLLELDRRDLRVDAAGFAHEVLVAGRVPVFAHPELIPALVEDLAGMHRLAEMGALFQITGTSIVGDYGRFTRDRCARLLDEGLAHFVASDAHSPDWRPPGLSRAYRAIAAGWADETALALTRDNPRAVIEDRLLPGRAETPAPSAAAGAPGLR